MSLYAKINSENIVENIIICDDSNINTQIGEYIKVTESTNQAASGYSYDKINNKFISIKPFESWTLDENFIWQPPTPQTVDNSYWDEESTSWIVRPIILE